MLIDGISERNYYSCGARLYLRLPKSVM